jgi:hypothetical protein
MVHSTTVFYSVIKYGKFALLTALLVLSFINGHKDYISENPRKFMWDCLAVGGTSAIGISIIAYMRGRSDLIVNLAFITFFLFFTYNVLRELSGFNAITGGGALTQGESNETQALTKPIMTFGAGMAGFMVVLAFAAHVGHPSGMMALVKEACVLGLFTAIGEGVLAKNHSYPLGPAIGGNFAMFFFAHIIMQFGGFYDHVFPPTPKLSV